MMVESDLMLMLVLQEGNPEEIFHGGFHPRPAQSLLTSLIERLSLDLGDNTALRLR